MITCSTHWLSLALVVVFLDNTYITLHTEASQARFLADCGCDISDDEGDEAEDKALSICECPQHWRKGAA